MKCEKCDKEKREGKPKRSKALDTLMAGLHNDESWEEEKG